MKTIIRIFLIIGCLAMLPTNAASGNPAILSANSLLAKDSRPEVGYSFDHHADNPKIERLFVSEEMLTILRSQIIQSDHWEFSQVVDRLSSILTMHTHSRSTTDVIRSDYQKVLTSKTYELLMHQSSKTTNVIVFGVRKKGIKLSELLIFRFRDNYCSRVVQLTGELTIHDIANIIKLNKKM